MLEDDTGEAGMNIDRQSLPPELVAQLSKPKLITRADDILQVLSGGEEMTVDEIIVKIYYERGYIAKKQVVLSRLSELFADDLVQRTRRGVYRLKGGAL